MYVSLILISSFVPLIYFNIRKDKKVFLGDSGSLFLGGIVSIYVLNILSPSYLIKPQYDINKVLFVISILFYPIIDLVRVFILRIARGRSPFKADKNHIHHNLNIKLKKHWQVSLTLTTITILAIIIIQIISRK
jgi:UDP-N-acetylmuramyl pentapeptide phosphotransferase/UDP-N-acetylglucosamine-1-phosphate transferase